MFRFLIILIFIPFTALGQNLLKDSDQARKLLNEKKYEEAVNLLEPSIAVAISNNTPKTDIVEAKFVLAKCYMHNWDAPLAKKHYKDAMQISESINNDSLYVSATLAVINILSYLEELDSIPILARRLLKGYELIDWQRSNLYTVMAGHYEDFEKVDSSIYYGTLAARLDSINQDSSSIPYAYYSLGIYHINDFNYQKGIEKILYGMRFLRKGKDDFKKSTIQIGLGQIYYRIGNITKAKEMAEIGLSMAEELNLQRAQVDALNLLGNCYKYSDDLEKALTAYIKSDSINSSKSKKVWRSGRAKISIMNTKLDLGLPVSREEVKVIREYSDSELLLLKNKADFVLLRVEENSIQDFERKYDRLFQESDSKNTKHLELSLLGIKKEFYEKKKAFAKANQIDKQIDKLKKEVDQINNDFIIQDLEAKYKKKQQEEEIHFLDTQNMVQSKILSQQRTAIIGGGIALGLISLLSFFLFRLYKRVNAQKEIITRALSEKDLLLREIHHRVKNNLQLVSSLLTLQARGIDDDTALEALNEGKARVRSMALIHQDLYNKENLTGVGVKEYFDKLVQELFETYRIDKDRIKLKTEIEDMDLDVDTLVPLGLIVNELITNSLKYAFPKEQEGYLNVSLRIKDDKLHLNVTDNGIGFNQDQIKKTSFGSKLISSLTDQLEGEIQIDSQNGTSTNIEFKDFKIAS